MAGHLGEMIMVTYSEGPDDIPPSEILFQSQRLKIEGYLAHKWGLTADLPSDHTYKTRCSHRLDDIDKRLSNIEVTFAKLQTRLYTGAVLITFVITTVINFMDDIMSLG